MSGYLDSKAPATYPQAITLRNRMPNTPGFEEFDKIRVRTDGAAGV